MPKYMLIGLGVTVILFLAMHYWSKLSDNSKKKIIIIIFGLIAVLFVSILGLLLF